MRAHNRGVFFQRFSALGGGGFFAGMEINGSWHLFVYSRSMLTDFFVCYERFYLKFKLVF